MKVTTKGQVTIPLKIREKVGIVPGSEVEFHEKNGQIIIRKSSDSGRGKEIVRRMTGKGDVKMTTDQILALTRGQR